LPHFYVFLDLCNLFLVQAFRLIRSFTFITSNDPDRLHLIFHYEVFDTRPTQDKIRLAQLIVGGLSSGISHRTMPFFGKLWHASTEFFTCYTDELLR